MCKAKGMVKSMEDQDKLEIFEPEKTDPGQIKVKTVSEEPRKKEKKKKKAKPPMDPKLRFRFVLLLDALLVVTAIILGFFLVRHLMNASFLDKYDKGVYATKNEEKLKKVNVVEGYLPYYNLGNVYYKEEKYDDAIASYKKALEYHPSHGKECSVRINLALAMIKKIKFDAIATEKDRDRAIDQLLAARAVLCEEGCADADDDNGHSEEAEKLKKDIDDMIEQLKNPPESDNQNQDDQDDNQNQDNQDQNQDQQQNQDQSQREKDIQDQLEKDRQQNQQERQQTQDEYNNEHNDDGGGESGQGGGGGGGSDDPSGKTW